MKAPIVDTGVTTKVVAITAINYLLVYVVNIILSRLLGPVEYGDYSVAVSVATIGFTLALLGKDHFTLKQLSIYLQQEQTAEARGFVVKNLQIVLVSSVILSLFLVGCYELVHLVMIRAHEDTLVFGFMLIPVMALVDYWSKVLIADQRVVRSMFLYRIVLPLLFMALILMLYSAIGAFTELYALAALASAWTLTLVAYFELVRRGLWARLDNSPSVYYTRAWITGGLPYMVNGLVLVVLQNTGILFLEVLHRDEKVVGVFAAVSHTASVMFIFFSATSAILLPKLASSVESRDLVQLDALFRSAFRTYFAIAAVFAVLFLLFGQEILFLFGNGFTIGYGPLIIVATGNLFGLLLGVATPVLQFAGHHRIVVTAFTVNLLANVCLNASLVLEYSVWGAAWALALPRIAVTTFLAYMVWRKLGVSVIPVRPVQKF